MQSSADKWHNDNKLSEMSFMHAKTAMAPVHFLVEHHLLHQSVWKRNLPILHIECVIIKNQKSSSKHFLEFHCVVVLLAKGGVKLYQKLC